MRGSHCSHSPRLPDEVWFIVLNMVVNGDDTRRSFADRTRLELTCKAFAQRSVFYRRIMEFHATPSRFVDSFFRKLTVDASKLYYLALKDCVLTTRDQLALSSCAWSISHLFVQNCNFDDYYLSLFLSKLDLTAYIDFQFHIFENFGPCASYEFARLLMKFHVAKAEDVEVVEVSLRVRWQTKLVDETHANHRRGWDYIHAAMRELSLACAGRREARIRSRIDIGTERNPLCLSYFHKIPMFVAWNEYSSEMYNSPCLRFENANRLADLASPARLSVDHGSAV